MIRVLFISYIFPPLGGAAAQRSLKFVRYLGDSGYLPIVLTGPGQTRDLGAPRDASLTAELPAGIPLHRVDGPIPAGQAKRRERAERWLGIAPPFSMWWVRSATALGDTLIRDGVKLIYATMSPFEGAEIAARLSEKHQIPWVADLRDPWAIDEIQAYPSWMHKKAAQQKMRRLLYTASVVIMNTPEATLSLMRHFPEFKKRRVVTVTNGFDAEDMADSRAHPANNKFTIVHTGSFLTDVGLERRRRQRIYEALGGATRGVDLATRSHLFLFEAISRWCADRPEIRDKVEVVFSGRAPDIGNLSPEEKSVLPMMRFDGFLPRAESVRLACSADLLFLPMHNLPPGVRSTSVPSKIYEYMASGRPILAAVPDGDAKDMLERMGDASICRPDDTAAIIAALQERYARWQNRDAVVYRDFEALKAFDRRYLTKQLATEFDAALAR
jgi:glycosyltransferase involved in cell wall biosynthesis